MQIRKGQIIAFIHFIPIHELAKVIEFGNFDDIGLPNDHSIHGLFNKEDVSTLPDKLQDTAVKFLNQFEHVFAKKIMILDWLKKFNTSLILVMPLL